jgi:ATP phosphoribosyltransferase regulatory subunit
MRYYLGAEARLRRRIEDEAMSVFAGWSYEEITTPALDYYALFERGMGRDEARRAFRLTDLDGSLLALRPDVTSSVARSAATLFADRPRPLRLSYAANVFRQQTPSHAEWRRETTQLGCELIGANSFRADIEVLAIAAEILSGLGLEHSCITLSSAEIFNGIAANLSLDMEQREVMRRLIDMKDGGELQQFLSPYATADERITFARLTRLSGKRSVLDKARSVITNTRSVAALDSLDRSWQVIESLGLSNLFEIDLGDVSGLDYYTGLIFKIYVEGAGSRVGRGGRYDELTASFGRAEPAIGFVLDLDAMTDVLIRRGATPLCEAANKPAMIGNKNVTKTFLDARGRRANGKRVRIDLKGED